VADKHLRFKRCKAILETVHSFARHKVSRSLHPHRSSRIKPRNTSLRSYVVWGHYYDGREMIQPVLTMPSAAEETGPEFRLILGLRRAVITRVWSSHTVSAIVHFGLILLILAFNITAKKHPSHPTLHVVLLDPIVRQTFTSPTVHVPQPPSPKSGVLDPAMRKAPTLHIAEAAELRGAAVPVPLTAPVPEPQLPVPPSLDADILSSVAEARDLFGKYSVGNEMAGNRGGSASQGTAKSCSQSEESARPRVENTPVEILAKPKPAYSVEARQLHLEGEVLLEVIFQASGGIRIMHIAHGLGHGLDETAAEATSHIRFKPATCGGTSIDVNATVHVTFRLPKRQSDPNS